MPIDDNAKACVVLKGTSAAGAFFQTCSLGVLSHSRMQAWGRNEHHPGRRVVGDASRPEGLSPNARFVELSPKWSNIDDHWSQPAQVWRNPPTAGRSHPNLSQPGRIANWSTPTQIDWTHPKQVETSPTLVETSPKVARPNTRLPVQTVETNLLNLVATAHIQPYPHHLVDSKPKLVSKLVESSPQLGRRAPCSMSPTCWAIGHQPSSAIALVFSRTSRA